MCAQQQGVKPCLVDPYLLQHSGAMQRPQCSLNMTPRDPCEPRDSVACNGPDLSSALRALHDTCLSVEFRLQLRVIGDHLFAISHRKSDRCDSRSHPSNHRVRSGSPHRGRSHRDHSDWDARRVLFPSPVPGAIVLDPLAVLTVEMLLEQW